MKNISGQKIFQYGSLLFIISLVTNHFARDWYGPIPDKDEGFPLQKAWETKFSDNIKEVYITENGNILVQLGYSVNLISPKTGDLIWKFRIDKPIYSVTSGNGKVYVFGNHSFLILNEVDGKSISENYSDYSVDSPVDSYVYKNRIVASEYGSVSLYNTESGEFLYKYHVGRGTIGVCPYADFLYTFNYQIDAFSLKNEKLIWSENSFGYVNDTVCDESKAYFIANDSRLVAYDLKARRKIWVKNFPVEDPYSINRVFNAGDKLVVEGINGIFIISKADGNVNNTIPVNSGLLGSKFISSVAIIENNLYFFEGFTQSIYSYDMTTWEQNGNLHLSFPVIAATSTERFINIDDMLILWKNKRLFAYK